jgi:hyaluronoglucosaminidase
MIRFMGESGFTHYVYAPKDDPYHRSRWRERYPNAMKDQFKELVSVADSAGISLIFAISPGLNIIYSDSADVAILKEKMSTMLEIGFDEVALFLDDVPEELRHDADKARFASLAEAHIHLVNAIKGGIPLMVCPTTYTDAWGDQEYVEQLSRGIGPDVPLFWTGRDVAPSSIRISEARIQRLKLKGDLYLWDNFPVNDFETWRPLLGALKGRAPELPKVVSGYFANPMESVYLSMLPLHTVATFGSDPKRYDPARALDSAITDLFTPATADTLRPILQLYAAAGWDDMLFTGLYSPGAPIDSAAIDSVVARFDQLPEGANAFERAFLRDLKPYLEKTKADWAAARMPAQAREPIRNLVPVEFDKGSWMLEDTGDSLRFSLKLDRGVSASWLTLVVTDSDIPRYRWVSPADRFYEIDLANGTVNAGHLALTEFSSRGIADIRLARISSFFHTFFVTDTTFTGTWTEGMVTVPRPRSRSFRVNVSIPGVYNAAMPGMLGNPWTFPVYQE